MSAGDAAPIQDPAANSAELPVVGDAAGAAIRVTQLLALLGDAVRSAGLVELWVSGTVTGLHPGPRFTTLKLVDYEADGSTVQSVLSVGMFAAPARQIRRTLATAGTELADGLEVALWGLLDLNPRYGRLRLLAQRVDPRTTVGAAVLARDDLVAELERCGRLQAQASLSVPPSPRRIGLVSSPTAAGRADVLAVLGRSPVPIDIVEAQAAMSGPAAPTEVARAIGRLAAADVDIVLVARGGGAKSDLAAWESRAVALAITACPCPYGPHWVMPPTTPWPIASPTRATHALGRGRCHRGSCGGVGAGGRRRGSAPASPARARRLPRPGTARGHGRRPRRTGSAAADRSLTLSVGHAMVYGCRIAERTFLTVNAVGRMPCLGLLSHEASEKRSSRALPRPPSLSLRLERPSRQPDHSWSA